MIWNLHVSPSVINQVMNVVHECSATCTFKETVEQVTIEREEVSNNKLTFVHDSFNNTFCLNIRYG